MMHLHSKIFEELNKDELQRELDYLSGQYDYVSICEYLPDDIKAKQITHLWNQIDSLTSRYILLSMKSIKISMGLLGKG